MAKEDFNPHSRTGSDGDIKNILDGAIISIHTPARGVTANAVALYDPTAISIHTPARGVTAILKIS